MQYIDDNAQASLELPKLYSIRTITIVTALFSCFAGAFLISRNFTRLNRPDESRKAFLFGLTGCTILAIMILTIELPSTFDRMSSLVFEGLQVGAVYLYAKRTIGPTLASHSQGGGKFCSTWRGIVVGLPLVAVPVAFFFVGMSLFPGAAGLLPEDKFEWSVAYHHSSDMEERGTISWLNIQHEVSTYPWVQELQLANETNGFAPTICVYNRRMDKFLTVEIAGTPQDYIYFTRYGQIGDDSGHYVLPIEDINRVLTLYRAYFNYDTSSLGSLYRSEGKTQREVIKMSEEGATQH